MREILHLLHSCWESLQHLIEEDWYIGEKVEEELAFEVIVAENLDISLIYWIIESVLLDTCLKYWLILDLLLILSFYVGFLKCS